MKVSMLSWVSTSCGLIGSASLSEEHTVSIFWSECGMIVRNVGINLESQSRRETSTGGCFILPEITLTSLGVV